MRTIIAIALAAILETTAAFGQTVCFDDAGGERTAATIRARGYYCPKAISLKRIRIDSAGNKHYRVSCGASGPDYLVIVAPDGGQQLTPLNRD
jgi:hypothetical protein